MQQHLPQISVFDPSIIWNMDYGIPWTWKIFMHSSQEMIASMGCDLRVHTKSLGSPLPLSLARAIWVSCRITHYLYIHFWGCRATRWAQTTPHRLFAKSCWKLAEWRKWTISIKCHTTLCRCSHRRSGIYILDWQTIEDGQWICYTLGLISLYYLSPKTSSSWLKNILYRY